MRIRRRLTIAGLGLGVLLAAGACGGGGGDDSTSSTKPTEPAANVDRGADGVITGPINRTKQVADDADARANQLDG
jgi:hypothetical protein